MFPVYTYPQLMEQIFSREFLYIPSLFHLSLCTHNFYSYNCTLLSMKYIAFFMTILIHYCYGSNISIFDPRVYNYYFYVLTNSQIILSNLTTESEAANHWSTIGIYQGLQACGSFHVLQFLNNYPNISLIYGTNYTGAIEYYLKPNGGYDNNLLGYTIGGGYGRYTLGNITNNLYISGSLRMGGSITSLVWNNIEFINNWAHGRQLQLTIHNGSGACYSPTEAGQHIDQHYNYTTSIILNISTTINNLKSSVFGAYWMYPGQYDNRCGYAINTINTSNYIINKQIKFGFDNNNDINKNVISYNNSFYIPEDHINNTVTFESPTAYLNKPFNTFQ